MARAAFLPQPKLLDQGLEFRRLEHLPRLCVEPGRIVQGRPTIGTGLRIPVDHLVHLLWGHRLPLGPRMAWLPTGLASTISFLINGTQGVNCLPHNRTSSALLPLCNLPGVFEKGLWAPLQEHPSAQRPFSKTTTFTDDWGDLNAYRG